MRKATICVLIAAGVLFVGALAVQHQSTRRVASEVAALRQDLAAGAPEQTATHLPERTRAVPSGNAAILQRLAALEETVAQLARNSEYLMDRGQLPLATNKLNDLFAKFTDVNASDRDRLQALRLLRRNGGITDDAVLQAVDWLKNATNANTREDILQQLEGVTNAALRESQQDAGMGAAFAEMLQGASDPFERAKLFAAFDDAIDSAKPGDAALLPALIDGLQDPSPLGPRTCGRCVERFHY